MVLSHVLDITAVKGMKYMVIRRQSFRCVALAWLNEMKEEGGAISPRRKEGGKGGGREGRKH